MKSIKLEKISESEIKLLGTFSKPKKKKVTREEIIIKVQNIVCNELYSKGLVPTYTKDFKIQPTKKDVNFEFTLVVNSLSPIKNLDGLKINRRKIEISKLQIDKELNDLKRDTVKFNILKEDQKISPDDLVYVNLKINKDFELEILLDERLSQVRKEISKLGETKAIEVKLPVDFKFKQYSGKTVKPTFEVTKVLTAKLPEIDDLFSKSIGFHDVVELIIHVIKRLKLKQKREISKIIKKEICLELLKKYQVEISDEAIEVCLQKLQENLKHKLIKAKWSKAEINKFLDETAGDLESEAILALKTECLFSQLALYFGIKDYDYSKLSHDDDKIQLVEDQIIDQIYDL